MKTMKKCICVLIAALMVTGIVTVTAEGPALGGWHVAESTAITEENRAVFDKAAASLLGVHYEPVAFLAEQVAAGMNRCYLCKAAVVYPGAEETLKLVFVYENPQGEAKITNIADLDIAALAVPEE